MLSVWFGLIITVGNLVYILESFSGGVSFWQLSSFAFVFTGVVGTAIFSCGVSIIWKIIGYFVGMLVGKNQNYSDRFCKNMIGKFVTISKNSGKDKVAMINALEALGTKKKDVFFKYVVDLLSVGYTGEQLGEIVGDRINKLFSEKMKIHRALADMGGSAPAFGMMGTVLGLIVVLSRIDDPSQLGQGLSIALITTLYGVVASRVCFIPLAIKMRDIAAGEKVYRELVLQACQMLADRGSPIEMEDYLNSSFK